MSEGNKLIIVDITDKEYSKLDVKSNLISIKGDGKVVTKNISQKSRLWNLANDLSPDRQDQSLLRIIATHLIFYLVL